MAYDVAATPSRLSPSERLELDHADAEGRAFAQVYRGGDFVEGEFVRLGTLQRLAIRGLADFQGVMGRPDAGSGDVTFRFHLTAAGLAERG